MTKEAKVDLLKLAIKHNPPGVRVVGRNLKAHLANLAHYIDSQDTDGLKQRLSIWLIGPGIIAASLDVHNNNFGSITLLRLR